MKIDKRVLLDFELSVLDMLESDPPKTAEDLEWVSATLHEHLETALMDFAMDAEIEDYDPQY